MKVGDTTQVHQANEMRDGCQSTISPSYCDFRGYLNVEQAIERLGYFGAGTSTITVMTMKLPAHGFLHLWLNGVLFPEQEGSTKVLHLKGHLCAELRDAREQLMYTVSVDPV